MFKLLLFAVYEFCMRFMELEVVFFLSLFCFVSRLSVLILIDPTIAVKLMYNASIRLVALRLTVRLVAVRSVSLKSTPLLLPF